MCGITGVFAFNLVGKFSKINTAAATRALAHRGPDFQDIYADEWVTLGHRRLSIIDTSERSHQPMWDETQRYCIVYNGEIFNYQELRSYCMERGITFKTSSDTEVLLKLYILEKEKCLTRLNGFFAFCIYDREAQTMFVARDPLGIKPLYYLFDQDKFLFASEMKAMIAYGLQKDIDPVALTSYLQLNYIPAPLTIFRSVKKLMPGHHATVGVQSLSITPWYKLPTEADPHMTYADASAQLKETLRNSVSRWLVSDVPLGAFLSGGVDSSVIAALAREQRPDLKTFSIGFSGSAWFDETPFAAATAKHLGTQHTVFQLSEEEMFRHAKEVLDHTDEPFADSSALAVFMLSRSVRAHATVALSGDGADELWGGYNKHEAFYRALHPGWKEKAVGAMGLLWSALPQSRHAPLSNRTRQLNRFARGYHQSSRDRYWTWAGFASESQVLRLLSASMREQLDRQAYAEQKSNWLSSLPSHETMNDILRTDTQFVLPNDMLTKVDRMSMAHGLEVRVPFLDVEAVELAFRMPDHFKVDAAGRKKILKDTFRDQFPEGWLDRPKKGFEVPLLRYLRKDMKQTIRKELLDEKFIVEQGLFDPKAVRKLRRQLFALSPGDVHARMWGLVVFQWWWKKYVA